MTFEEKEAAYELRYKISKRNIKIYGPNVIHHEFNLMWTCAGCNDSVLVNHSSVPGQSLIKEIKEDIQCR
ncbi:MAG: hypothetical protein B6I30_09515 [Desulfobacteraceae bacterium 4572_187]|nr:MAG: hypothetical protein B6I30_09515 [Desulfobacteraceae bacterium 4572_187]